MKKLVLEDNYKYKFHFILGKYAAYRYKHSLVFSKKHNTKFGMSYKLYSMTLIIRNDLYVVYTLLKIIPDLSINSCHLKSNISCYITISNTNEEHSLSIACIDFQRIIYIDRLLYNKLKQKIIIKSYLMIK